jgi:hypothetical protein
MYFHDPVSTGSTDVSCVIFEVIRIVFLGAALSSTAEYGTIQSYFLATGMLFFVAGNPSQGEGNIIPVAVPLVHYVKHVGNPDHLHTPKITRYTRVRKDREYTYKWLSDVWVLCLLTHKRATTKSLLSDHRRTDKKLL